MVHENFFSLYLKNVSSFEVEADVHFSLLNNDNFKVKEWKTSKQLFLQQRGSWGNCTFAEQSFVMDSKNNLLKEGEIRIGVNIVIDKILNLNYNSFNRLKGFDNLEKLFLNEKYSDLTVVSADKKKIQVYRGILASCSPVFEAMFEHDMVEKNLSVLNIEDIEYEVLVEVFRFMYTGKVNSIITTVSKLLYAAEKYSIEGLKILCEETLLKHLVKSNAIEYLIVADQNSSSSVKMKIIKFIADNVKNYVDTSEFISLGTTRFDLMHEIMKLVISEKK